MNFGMGAIGRAIKSATYRLLESWDERVNAYAPPRAKSGKAVNWKTALEVTTVLACARVLAEGVAQVPFKLFQDSADSRLPAVDHPHYALVRSNPNEWQTWYEFAEQMMLHLVLCGAAFAYKNVVRGQIEELILFEPQNVTVRRAGDGTLSYRVMAADGSMKDFSAAEIWHLRGPSWNGWKGLDVVHLAREAIGLALATEEQHALLHANGVSPSGIYSVEGTLKPDQHEDLMNWINKHYVGENRGKPLLLDRNAKWLTQAMNGVDAQHIETRRLQIEELCRAARVMPIMVGHSDKAATYASAEQMFIAHVVYSLTPWYARIEQSANLNLLTREERKSGLYFKFIAAGLLRGSMNDRASYFAKALGAGGAPAWMTQDEVRHLEEMNPMGGAAAKLPVITNAPKTPAPEPTGA